MVTPFRCVAHSMWCHAGPAHLLLLPGMHSQLDLACTPNPTLYSKPAACISVLLAAKAAAAP